MVRVGIEMRMLIIMTRTPIMLGGDKQAKRKVKFPCKLCKENHLTYLCPRIDEALRFLAQGPAVLTNHLPHNQNMNSRTHDQSGGDQDFRRVVVMVALTWYILQKL